MSFDRERLADAIARHGAVARVVIAEVKGSAPRDVGAAMLVWPGGQSGTIGGGALEFEATERAIAVLKSGTDRFERKPLGPDLGQCCGGAVKVLTERWDRERLDGLVGNVVARALPGRPDAQPMAVARALKAMRGQGTRPDPALIENWFIEPISAPERALWVWGAGHVGRAIVDVLSPLPHLAITWVDTGPERFPSEIPPGVTALPAAAPGPAIAAAPGAAEHLVLTYSHPLDLEICHLLLGHGFKSAGLIGSKTKWARFRARLKALGHGDSSIARITCPIGDPALGKHPQAIAIGVAAAFIDDRRVADREGARA
ncbi:MAG: xanthine dehydrogenase accessory protein XdhC [Pseudomonadota bacterium]